MQAQACDMEKPDLLDFSLAELEGEMAALGQPKFRARQIYDWMYKNAHDFSEMKNLPRDLQARLAARYRLGRLEIARRLVSRLDGTVKYLFRLPDGEHIESVFMRYHHGNTVCISTQVGCRMGCAFCASTLQGRVRDLRASEMLLQVMTIQQDVGEPVSNIVLMGMGEPLDNFDNTLRFLRLVNSPDGMNIGMRHISLSTCGLVDKIYRLMEENLQVTLSISLHAPSDAIRNTLMPVNRKWNMDALLAACRAYAERTGRRISFEYTLIDGVNDRKEDALLLARRLKGMLCHVNLIPVNPIKERDFRAGKKENSLFFCKVLKNQGICATIRRTLGGDIDASCGQLRQQETHS